MTQDALADGPSRQFGHRTGVSVVAAVLLVLAAVLGPFEQAALPANPGFLPAFGALVVLTELLTAVLLLVQSGLPGCSGVRGLGAAYLFSGLIAIPHILAFPGVFAAGPVIGGAQSAVYLWCFWHGGFALGILSYLLRGDSAPRSRGRRGVIVRVLMTVLALTVVVTLGADWLPPLVVAGDFRRLIWSGIGPGILALTIVAFALSLRRRRADDALDLWLSVAMLAAALDVTLTIFGGGRFTLGWYSARIMSLLTGVVMLCSLLAELMRGAGRTAEVNQQLERLLLTDVLTQVANRRAFDGAIVREWARAAREHSAISILMIDIDTFKGFNDRYGHPAGDECLARVARALSAAVLRPTDLVARMGGEEFAILLPATDNAGAWEVANRALDCVAALSIPHAASEHGVVTVSIGVATTDPSASQAGPAETIAHADHQLYRAKSGGRNRISGARPPLRAVA